VKTTGKLVRLEAKPLCLIRQVTFFDKIEKSLTRFFLAICCCY